MSVDDYHCPRRPVPHHHWIHARKAHGVLSGDHLLKGDQTCQGLMKILSAVTKAMLDLAKRYPKRIYIQFPMHSVIDFSCKPFGSWKKTKTPQRTQVTSCRLSPSDPSKSSNKKPHLYLWPWLSCKTNDTFLRSVQEEFQGILPSAFWCSLFESLKSYATNSDFFSDVIPLLKNTN